MRLYEDMTYAERVIGTFGDAFADAATKLASSLGADAGYVAGTWVIDGRTPDAECARLLTGLAEGDPAIYDDLPTCDLSGTWADRPTADDIAARVMETFGIDVLTQGSAEACDGDLRCDDAWTWFVDDVADAYRDAFDREMEDEVTGSALARLGLRPGTDDPSTFVGEVAIVSDSGEVSAIERTFTTDELREHFAPSRVAR